MFLYLMGHSVNTHTHQTYLFKSKIKIRTIAPGERNMVFGKEAAAQKSQNNTKPARREELL